MTDVKHKAMRSFARLLGQGVGTDAAGKQIATGAPIECRIAYPYLHEVRTKTAAGDKIDNPGHECSILVPQLNADPVQCPNYAAIAAHCMEAATAAWGMWPEGGKWPIQNGNIPHKQVLKPGQVPLTAEQIAERNKWRAGFWIIEVSSSGQFPPQVAIVQNGVEQEVKTKSAGGQQFYKSGDHGYVFLHAYTFHNKTFGVNFGFNGVCFTRPGEKIGNSGQRSVASMFGGVGASIGPGMATATPPGPPAAGHPYAPGGVGHPPAPPAPGTAPMPPQLPVAPATGSAPTPPAPPATAYAPPMPPAPPATAYAPPMPPAAPTVPFPGAR